MQDYRVCNVWSGYVHLHRKETPESSPKEKTWTNVIVEWLYSSLSKWMVEWDMKFANRIKSTVQAVEGTPLSVVTCLTAIGCWPVNSKVLLCNRSRLDLSSKDKFESVLGRKTVLRYFWDELKWNEGRTEVNILGRLLKVGKEVKWREHILCPLLERNTGTSARVPIPDEMSILPQAFEQVRVSTRDVNSRILV